MVTLDNNNRSTEHLVAEQQQQQPPINTMKNSEKVSDTQNARTDDNVSVDWLIIRIIRLILYVFFFNLRHDLVVFFRKSCFSWSISNSAIGAARFFVFTCVAMFIGILVVCYTAPKPQGMFF